MEEAEELKKFIHDLANPLGIAIGSLKLLAPKTSPDVKEKIEKSIYHLERAIRVIDEKREELGRPFLEPSREV